MPLVIFFAALGFLTFGTKGCAIGAAFGSTIYMIFFLYTLPTAVEEKEKKK